jgi:PAS domain S-box-containing protein
MDSTLQLHFTESIVDDSADGIVICDTSLPGMPIVFANPAFALLSGYPLEQVIGRSCGFLQNEEVDQDANDRLRVAICARLPIRITLRNYRRDGSMFWNEMTLYPLQSDAGAAHYYAGIQRDVTALVSAEDTLRIGRAALEDQMRERTAELLFSNALLRQEVNERRRAEQSLIDTKTILTIAQRVTQLGSWVYDIAAETLRWSDEIFTICGLPPQSLKPTVALANQLSHPDDRDAATALFWRCIHEGRDYRSERRILRADGSVRHVRVWGKIIRDEFNTPVRMVGSYLDITEHREAEQGLRDSQETLRMLSAHQERIKEEERKRIAREIHDELGGLLTGIRAYLSVAADQARRNGVTIDAQLIEATRLADSAIGTVRRVITDLRPSVLDELGIWSAIEWLVERTAKSAGLDWSVSIDDAAAATELDPDRSIALFRVVQEALTNVQRHARASRVQLRATRCGTQLHVGVLDDGIGLDTARIHEQHSWGLVGMQERVGYFGGSVRISGKPGGGTEVSVSMPLQVMQ